MNITFLGGADEVGASSILIEIGGRRLLVDAGIRPTPKARWGLAGDQLPDLDQIERSGGIDAILVTHAHTDHTGALELVMERYPSVPVYATPVTIELTRVLHQDARRIMQMRLEEEGELPLFDEVATTRLLNAFTPVQLKQPLTLAPGLTATFFLAGHIAGAAMIGLSSSEGRILISGDISISPQRTVDGARPPAFSPDVLILESTYGGRLHANRHAEERRLVETVAEVTAAGGKVLIPAFALGRAQEILLILGEFQRRGELADVPVWADGMVRVDLPVLQQLPRRAAAGLAGTGRHLLHRTDPAGDQCGPPQRADLGARPGGYRRQFGHVGRRPIAGLCPRTGRPAAARDPAHRLPGRGVARPPAAGDGAARARDSAPGQGQDRRAGPAGDILALCPCRYRANGQLGGDARPGAGLSRAWRRGRTPQPCRRAAARGRNVRLPRAGQSFGFNFTPAVRPAPAQGIGQRRPLDLQRLWHALQATGDAAAGANDLVTLLELAQTWWGERPAPSRAQMATLAAALAADDRYFAPDRSRADVYRVRSRDQVELATRRQAQMAAHGDLHRALVAGAGPGRRSARRTGGGRRR